MTASRGGPALAVGLRSLRSLLPAARAKGKTLGRTGEARCLFPLNACNFQLPKVRNFRLPLTAFHEGRWPRNMTRWAQLAALALGQLSGRCGLRDVVANLAAQPQRLYHLGVGRVARSSLARVNAGQPHELCEALFGRLPSRCQGKAPRHGFRFRNRLLSLDSTTIDLCLAMFPWASFRRTKGAVKLHVCLDRDGFPPAFMKVTNGRESDIKAARALSLPKGSIVAADRAYLDFAWINQLISQGIFLVTRMKKGVRHKVLERRPVAPALRKRGVTCDRPSPSPAGAAGGAVPIRCAGSGSRTPTPVSAASS